jgi:hypothetical protein
MEKALKGQSRCMPELVYNDVGAALGIDRKKEKALKGRSRCMLELVYNDVGASPRTKYCVYGDPAGAKDIYFQQHSSALPGLLATFRSDPGLHPGLLSFHPSEACLQPDRL